MLTAGAQESTYAYMSYVENRKIYLKTRNRPRNINFPTHLYRFHTSYTRSDSRGDDTTTSMYI